MNKVYFLGANESWICDRFKQEWDEDNSDISVQNPWDSDVLWLNSSWCWRRLPLNLLKERKVITTIHHIVPEKFDLKEQRDFQERDQITDVYHVCNTRMMEFIKNYTNKPVFFIPYWCNQNIFKKSSLTKEQLRNRHGLPVDKFIIASFQRDTEGNTITSGQFEPKREKGPDLFCDAIEKLNKQRSDVHVLLTAWRRQYVIKRLLETKIPYTYYELPQHDKLVELYQCLDLYMVTSRCEGGPQAMFECGLLNVPLVSTPVGAAEQVLPLSAINWDVTQAIPAIPCIEHLLLPQGYQAYRDLIKSL